MQPAYTKQDVASWPEGHKRCRVCQEIHPFSNFHKERQSIFGLSNVCKACRKIVSSKNYWDKSLEKLMVERAKTRSAKNGLEVTITDKDIVIPELCPVFHKPLIRGDFKWAPSLDRIDSTKGYIPGNIQVISRWANTLKGDATLEDITRLYKFMGGNYKNL